MRSAEVSPAGVGVVGSWAGRHPAPHQPLSDRRRPGPAPPPRAALDHGGGSPASRVRPPPPRADRAQPPLPCGDGAGRGAVPRGQRRLWASVGCAPTERVLQLSRTGVGIRVQESERARRSCSCTVARRQRPAGLRWSRCCRVCDASCSTVRAAASARVWRRASPTWDAWRRSPTRSSSTCSTRSRSSAATSSRPRSAATSHARGGRASGPVNRVVQLGWTVGAPIGRTPAAMRLTSVPGLGRLLTSIPPTERAVRAIYRNVGLRGALEAGRISPEGIAWFLSLLRDTTTMRNELDAGPAIVRALPASTATCSSRTSCWPASPRRCSSCGVKTTPSAAPRSPRTSWPGSQPAPSSSSPGPATPSGWTTRTTSRPDPRVPRGVTVASNDDLPEIGRSSSTRRCS